MPSADKRILVTYATMAGSTADVAKVVGEEIAKSEVKVDVLPIREVKDLHGYDGVVLGGPMIMGWHRNAIGFLKKHRTEFQRIPLAVFVMSMSLTKTEDMSLDGVRITIDEKLPKPPADPAHLKFKERYAQVQNYLRPILTVVQPAKPASIAVFGGRLEYGRLKWWAVLFVAFVIQAPAGDWRNWDAIKAWAAEVGQVFR
jgi:menaquinone-dependent protoporphyrinogen oxidase